MLQDLAYFDPISYLNIDVNSLSSKEVSSLRNDLNSKLGEYVLLKLSDQLTEKEFDYIIGLDGQQMLELMHSFVPDLNHKMLQVIENFKKEYTQKGI